MKWPLRGVLKNGTKLYGYPVEMDVSGILNDNCIESCKDDESLQTLQEDTTEEVMKVA